MEHHAAAVQIQMKKHIWSLVTLEREIHSKQHHVTYFHLKITYLKSF